MLVMKQSNTSERIAGFLKKDRFYVTHAFSSHDDYEQTLGNYSKSDFDNKEFIDWEFEDDLGVDENDRDALAVERDKLLAENKQLKQRIEVLKEDMEDKELQFEIQKEETTAKLNECRAEEQSIKHSYRELEKKLHEANSRKTVSGFLSKIKKLFRI